MPSSRGSSWPNNRIEMWIWFLGGGVSGKEPACQGVSLAVFNCYLTPCWEVAICMLSAYLCGTGVLQTHPQIDGGHDINSSSEDPSISGSHSFDNLKWEPSRERIGGNTHTSSQIDQKLSGCPGWRVVRSRRKAHIWVESEWLPPLRQHLWASWPLS